jgi:hypothetical protein
MNGGGGGATRACPQFGERMGLLHLSLLDDGERKVRDLKLDFTKGETDATSS